MGRDWLPLMLLHVFSCCHAPFFRVCISVIITIRIFSVIKGKTEQASSSQDKPRRKHVGSATLKFYFEKKVQRTCLQVYGFNQIGNKAGSCQSRGKETFDNKRR